MIGGPAFTSKKLYGIYLADGAGALIENNKDNLQRNVSVIKHNVKQVR